MRYLPDTQLLLWASAESPSMPKDAALFLNAPGSEVFFSAASLWEVAIKFGRGKPDFQFDPQPLRRGLLRAGYIELSITSEHVMYVCQLPHIHKDPFDRLLIAQAVLEGITLLTTDTLIGQYPGPIQQI